MISLSLPSNNLNFVRLLEISCFYGVTGNEHSPEMGQVTRRTKLVLFWDTVRKLVNVPQYNTSFCGTHSITGKSVRDWNNLQKKNYFQI